jgi:hypothetical protein
MAAQNNQLHDIIQKAQLSQDPIIQEALRQERSLRERTAKELSALLLAQKKLTAEIEKSKSELEVAKLKKLVEANLKRDADLMDIINAKLMPLKAGAKVGDTTITYPLKFNKMKLILAGTSGTDLGAQAVVQSHFDKLFYGDMPNNYDFTYTPSAITIQGDGKKLGIMSQSPSLYGNSKASYYKAAVITTHLACLGKNLLSDINLLSDEQGPWFKRSAMIHATPIPVDFNLATADARFAQFPYLADNHLHFIHSGYSYGGGRDGSKNPWAPEDCSSWISKITACPVTYSTVDQLCFYRVNMKFGFVPEPWLKAPELAPMTAVYDVVDPLKAEMGQAVHVFSQCKFNVPADSKTKMDDMLATGHTGVVLGVAGKGKDAELAVLSYNRDMPTTEGFGVVSYPLFPSDPHTKLMLFSVKPKVETATAVTGLTTTTAVALK